MENYLQMIMMIKRVSSTKDGVFGVFIDSSGYPFALTAERPDLDNKQGISCIPEGTYTCKRIISPHFGETFQILNVPHRTNILLHKGNVPMKDSAGCILVGEQFERIGGRHGVAASKHGYNEFMHKCAGADMFILQIMNQPGS